MDAEVVRLRPSVLSRASSNHGVQHAAAKAPATAQINVVWRDRAEAGRWLGIKGPRSSCLAFGPLWCTCPLLTLKHTTHAADTLYAMQALASRKVHSSGKSGACGAGDDGGLAAERSTLPTLPSRAHLGSQALALCVALR